MKDQILLGSGIHSDVSQLPVDQLVCIDAVESEDVRKNEVKLISRIKNERITFQIRPQFVSFSLIFSFNFWVSCLV